MEPLFRRSCIFWEDLLEDTGLKIIRFLPGAILTVQESVQGSSAYCLLCIWNPSGENHMFRCSDSVQISGSCRALAVCKTHNILALASADGLYILSFSTDKDMLEFRRMAKVEIYRDTNDIKALRISPESKTLTITLNNQQHYKVLLPDLSSEGYEIKVA